MHIIFVSLCKFVITPLVEHTNKMIVMMSYFLSRQDVIAAMRNPIHGVDS